MLKYRYKGKDSVVIKGIDVKTGDIIEIDSFEGIQENKFVLVEEKKLIENDSMNKKTKIRGE